MIEGFDGKSKYLECGADVIEVTYYRRDSDLIRLCILENRSGYRVEFFQNGNWLMHLAPSLDHLEKEAEVIGEFEAGEMIWELME